MQASRACHTPVTRIGQLTATPGLQLHDTGGQALDLHPASFDHFA